KTQQIAWPVSEWTWMLVQSTADSSSSVLASSGMWMLATSTGLMLQLRSRPETKLPSALRHSIATSVENGDAGYHGAPPEFSGIVVEVARSVMVPLSGGTNEPPSSPPPPPQPASTRPASSSPRVLPNNFMSCLQASLFVWYASTPRATPVFRDRAVISGCRSGCAGSRRSEAPPSCRCDPCS